MNQVLFNSIRGSQNVITGCGSGLGKATLQWFLKNDCGPTLGIDRHLNGDFKNELDLSKEQEGKLMLRTCETFDAKVETHLQNFVSKHGRIDNLINVAGVALAFAVFSKGSGGLYNIEHLDNLLNFNTVGTFNMIRIVSKHMIESAKTNSSDRTMCIVNTSSISTSAPTFGQSGYASSNAAIDSMTLCLARELSPFKIRCNTINVGYFETQLIRASDLRVHDFLTTEVSLCPKRLGKPDEFSHLVQAIIENQMLNGCCIKLDGASKEAHI